MSKNVHLIVAVQKNLGIGYQGDQPYSFKEDFENFQKLTMGGTVIMGRKTWEAIPERFRPLPNRLNIVVTRNPEYVLPDNTHRAPSYESAKNLAYIHNPNGQIWNIGGAALYEQALSDCETEKIFITRIDGDKNCDTFFPDLYQQNFKKIQEFPLIYSKNRFDGKIYSFVFEEWQRTQNK